MLAARKSPLPFVLPLDRVAIRLGFTASGGFDLLTCDSQQVREDSRLVWHGLSGKRAIRWYEGPSQVGGIRLSQHRLAEHLGR